MALPGTSGALPQHSDILTAIPSSPEDTQNLISELKRRGNAAFKTGSYLESEMLYAKAIEHDPKGDPAIWGNRSAARIGMRKFTEALLDADEAVKLGWIKGHFRRGQALSGLNRWREAEKAFETCVSFDATNKEAKKEAEKAKSKADEEENKMDVVQVDDKSPIKSKENNNNDAKKISNKTKTNPDNNNNNTNDDEDDDNANMRGYKTLEDGRKTTYFHREIDPEEKEKLAQANKPVAITSTTPPPANNKDGSAWNAAGTFEEKDMTKWASDRIKELVKGCTTVFDPINSSDSSGIVEATNVTDFDGVASVSFIRGSRRYPFDFTFNVDWTASIAEGEFSGKLFYSQFSSDDDTFETEVKWENREKAGKAAKPLFDHIKKDFRAEVDAKLRTFIEDFRRL